MPRPTSCSPIPAKRIHQMVPVLETTDLEDALALMRRAGRHLAQVRDADGDTTAVLFLEDIIEELIGEVQDATRRRALTARRAPAPRSAAACRDGQAGAGADVLLRPVVDLGAELGCRAQGEVRVAQPLASGHDGVGVACGEHPLGLRGIRDHADGAHRHAGAVAHVRRRSRPGSPARRRCSGARRGRRWRCRRSRRRARPPSARRSSSPRRPSRRRPSPRPRSARTAARRARHPGPRRRPQQQAGAVLERAAVLVVAVVRQRREELVQQVAVRGVDLEHLEAGVDRAARGGGEVVDDASIAGGIQRRPARRSRRTRSPTARRSASRPRSGAPSRDGPRTATTSTPCGRRARAGRPRARRARGSPRRSAPTRRAARRSTARCPRARCAPRARPRSPRRSRCPAPPEANCARCVWCHSCGTPSTALYWHIGATQRRLRAVRPRSVRGENRMLIDRLQRG